MNAEDTALSIIRTDISRVRNEMEILDSELVGHGKTLVEHGFTLEQVRKELGGLEGRYLSLKECVVHVEATLSGLGITILNLNKNVEDIKGWMMKLLFLAFVALVVMALGSRAAEVFKLGVM